MAVTDVAETDLFTYIIKVSWNTKPVFNQLFKGSNNAQPAFITLVPQLKGFFGA
jgi:hypothetical protein